MPTSEVKGELFQQAQSYVQRKWGMEGAVKISLDPDQFKPEEWYPLEDFTELLADIVHDLADANMEEAYKVGRWMVMNNVKWAGIFSARKPQDIFSSNANQKTEYKVGEVRGLLIHPNSLQLHIEMWTDDKESAYIWGQFYRGRLQGVLDLSGTKGQARVIVDYEEDKHSLTYDLTWI